MTDKPARMRALPRLDAATVATLERDHRGRLESLLAVDDAVAGIVRALRRARELDDTLIVFTSDNGWLEGAHRAFDVKYLPYERSIRVPLLLRGPGVPAGRRVGATAINVDLAATVVDAANARAGRRLDGVSLLPLARRPARAPRRAVPLEAQRPLFALPGFPYEFAQPYVGVRTARWKYVRWSYGDEELYDLRADPYELRNLAGAPRHARRKRRLAVLADRLARCAGAACRAAR